MDAINNPQELQKDSLGPRDWDVCKTGRGSSFGEVFIGILLPSEEAFAFWAPRLSSCPCESGACQSRGTLHPVTRSPGWARFHADARAQAASWVAGVCLESTVCCIHGMPRSRRWSWLCTQIAFDPVQPSAGLRLPVLSLWSAWKRCALYGQLHGPVVLHGNT